MIWASHSKMMFHLGKTLFLKLKLIYGRTKGLVLSDF